MEVCDPEEDIIQHQAALLSKQQTTIDDLKDEISNLKEKLDSEQNNYSVHLESLQKQVYSFCSDSFGTESQCLRSEVENCLKEKEIFKQECKKHASEVHRLKNDISASRMTRIDDSQALSDGEYAHVILTLEEETERLRECLGRTEEEKIEIMKLNKAYKDQLVTMEVRLTNERHENAFICSQIHEKEENLGDTKDALTTSQLRCNEQDNDLQALVLQNEILCKSKTRFTQLIGHMKTRLEEAETKVLTGIRVAEDALLEKDKALLREKVALDEICRLESTIAAVSDDAIHRVHCEMEKLKTEYNGNLGKMAHEMSSLEMSLNEKQIELERCRNVTQRAEKELEKSYKEMQKGKRQHEEEVTELRQRIASLETRLTSVINEKDTADTVYSETVMDLHLQREEMNSRLNELVTTLSKTRMECGSIRQDLQELIREKNSLNQKVQSETDAYLKNEKKLKNELRICRQEFEEMKRKFNSKLESANISQNNLIAELQNSILQLQENKLRLESHLNTQRNEYEEQLSDEKKEIREHMQRIQQLSQDLVHMRGKLALTEVSVQQQKIRADDTELYLKKAEKRFSQLATQLDYVE